MDPAFDPIPLLLAIALALVVGPVLLAIRLTVWTVRSSDGLRTLESWAEHHDVRLTSTTSELVQWYLTTSKVLRTLGAVAGGALPSLAVWSLGLAGRASSSIGIGVVAGYLIGAVYAEVALVRRGDPTLRRASLVRRQLGDYLRPSLLAAQRGLGAFGALAVAVTAAVPVPSIGQPLGHPLPTGERSFVVALAVAMVGSAIALEVVERWLVSCPQPFDLPAHVAADDAIRATSLHAVACAGVAALLLGTGVVCLWLAGSDIHILRLTMWVPGMLAWPLALFTFLPIARRPRRVPRRRPQAATA